MIARSFAVVTIALFSSSCSKYDPSTEYVQADPRPAEDSKVYKVGDTVSGSNYSIKVVRAYAADKVGKTHELKAKDGSALIVIEYEVKNTGPLKFHGHKVPALTLKQGDQGYMDDMSAMRFFYSAEDLKNHRYAEEFLPGETRPGVTIVDFPRQWREPGKRLFAETIDGRKIELPSNII